jgi:hypothetical protein
MRAHAHLRLIVSEPAAPTEDEALRDRPSMIQPLDPLRLRLHWIRARAISLLGIAVVLGYSVWRSFD